MLSRLLLFFTILWLSACSSSQHFAPVTNGWTDKQAASQTYRVQPEDTLYSIAFRYGLDYRQLALANHINEPYPIVVGQTLKLLPNADDTLTTAAAPNAVASAPKISVVSLSPANKPSVKTVPVSVATGPVSQWQWPAKGKVIHTFSDVYGGNKGIDIAGTLGEPVHATAAGRVVYCGSGLRGYGLLIIVKHNAEYLSAYAHNSKALIKEGDKVNAGELIALMGSTDASQVMLHFEIRKAGKPVDPLQYLPALH